MTNEFWQGLLTGFLLATVAVSCVWLLLSEWWEARRVVPVVQKPDDWGEEDDWLDDEDLEYREALRKSSLRLGHDYTPEDQEALLRWSQ